MQGVSVGLRLDGVHEGRGADLGRFVGWGAALLAGILAVTSCSSPGSSSPQQNQATSSDSAKPATPSRSTTSTTSPAPTSHSSRPEYSLIYSKGIRPAERQLVRDLIRFAISPSRKTADEANFVPRELLLRLGADVERTIDRPAARRPPSWVLNNGEVSASALFVFSNSLRRAEGNANSRLVYLAAVADRPSCSLPSTGPATTARVIRIAVAEAGQVDCSAGFAVELNLDRMGRISAVFLSVRAP